MEPRLLILDEPTAQLDAQGREELLKVMRRLKRRGVAFLVCEHHPERLGEVVNAHWELNAGHLRAVERSLPKAAPSASPRAQAAAIRREDDGVLVTARHLEGEGAAGEMLWGGLTFSVGKGECVAVQGVNGSGKTTLLRCLAGFARPASGELAVLGREPRAEELRGRVGCLYQNPSRQLFESTVGEEVAFSRRRLRPGDGLPEEGAARTLAQCGIADLAEHSPHKLSYGQAHLVGLASALACEPELLLLDDPLAGLDPARGRILLDLLRSVCRDRGMGVVWTTHDSGAVPTWVDRRVELAAPSHDR